MLCAFGYKQVIADFSRGVFSPLNGKKGSQKNPFSYYQNFNSSTLPNRHIYYEPPEDFDWDATSSLLPDLNVASGEVIVHQTPTSPESKSDNSRKDSGLPQSDTNTSPDNSKDLTKDKERAYTEEEFTSAILARSLKNSVDDVNSDVNDLESIVEDMGDSGVVASMVRDSVVSNGQSIDGHECDCERRCSNPKHGPECKSGDYTISPILERRNKSVLGRLRNFAVSICYTLCPSYIVSNHYMIPIRSLWIHELMAIVLVIVDIYIESRNSKNSDTQNHTFSYFCCLWVMFQNIYSVR